MSSTSIHNKNHSSRLNNKKAFKNDFFQKAPLVLVQVKKKKIKVDLRTIKINNNKVVVYMRRINFFYFVSFFFFFLEWE